MSEAHYTIRPTEVADIKTVAANIRQADKEELWAASHMTPFQALKGSYLISRDISFVGEADGKVACMFGCKPPTKLSDIAVPWMVGTNELKFHSRRFLRLSRKMVEVWRKEFPYMENYVDERNVEAVRWLQWVGFSVYYPKPYGPDGLPFHRFDMET